MADNVTQAGEPLVDRYSQRGDRDIIGTSVPRLDAIAKVTGAAKYTHDLYPTGVLHAVAVRSPYASATVITINDGVARTLPGVVEILTYPGKRIRYAGEEVAVVAAETLGQARDGARALEVEYEAYAAVVNIEDAISSGAPQVYDTKPNAGEPRVSTTGDVVQGFSQADVVYEADYRTQIQTHSPMETHAAVIHWHDFDHATVWIATQGIFSARDELATYHGVPPENIKVICDYIGGGFGSKIGIGTYGRMCSDLSRLSGRPVRLILDRKAEQLATGNRPNSIQHLKVGARSDGTLTAIELTGYATPGVGSGSGFGSAARGLYDCPNISTTEIAVYTNCGPAAAMRAPGHPQGVFSMEAAMDELAYELGLDPVEIRITNDPHKMRRAQLRLGAEKFGWAQRNPVPGGDSGPVKRGMGVATCTWVGGGTPGYQVKTTLHPDGRVLVQTGTQDIGTGCRTWIGMLVAEELGLPLEKIQVEIGHTDLPVGCFAGGSTTTPSMSPPSRESGQLAREALAEVVAPVFGGVPSQLTFQDGLVMADNGVSMTFEEACSYLDAPISLTGSRGDIAKVGRQISTGAHFAEVEVDVRTGKITVLRVLAVHDAGRILNRLTAESQVYGGVIMGMNYALFEERVMDVSQGLMLNANLEGYKIGGSRDIPEITPLLMDLASGGSYVGALGLGESPTIPTAAAIANAVRHAIGVRLTEIPMTPSRVLAALGTINRSPKYKMRRR